MFVYMNTPVYVLPFCACGKAAPGTWHVCTASSHVRHAWEEDAVK